MADNDDDFMCDDDEDYDLVCALVWLLSAAPLCVLPPMGYLWTKLAVSD